MATTEDTFDAVSEGNLNVMVAARKTSKDTIALKKFVLENCPNGVDHSNVMEAVVKCVRFLAKAQKKLTGQQKKKLIIDALLLVLDETDSGFMEGFEPLIKVMIPTVVDNLIDVEKGKIKLNKGIRSGCCFLC